MEDTKTMTCTTRPKKPYPFDAALRDHIRAHTDGRILVGRGTDSERVTIRCPVPGHTDRRPSCVVGARGFRCYGCGASGDVFDLARHVLKIDHFPDILRELARRAGIDLVAERARRARSEDTRASAQNAANTSPRAKRATRAGSDRPTRRAARAREEDQARHAVGTERVKTRTSTPKADSTPRVEPARAPARSAPPTPTSTPAHPRVRHATNPSVGANSNTESAAPPPSPARMSQERRLELGAKVYAHILSSMTLGTQGTAYLESRGLTPATCRLLGVRSTGARQWEWVMAEALDGFGGRVLTELGLGKRGPDGEFLPHPHGRSPMLVFGYGPSNSMCGLRFRLLGDVGRGPRYLSLRSRAGRLPLPYLADERFRPTFGALTRRVLVVTEGELNALSCVQVGIPVVGLPGAVSWRDEWVMGLGGYERVVVLLDGDEASDRLAASIRTSARVFWGQDWIDSHLAFTTLCHPDTGEVMDANDALVADLLTPGWLLESSHTSGRITRSELEIAS